MVRDGGFAWVRSLESARSTGQTPNSAGVTQVIREAVLPLARTLFHRNGAGSTAVPGRIASTTRPAANNRDHCGRFAFQGGVRVSRRVQLGLPA